MMRRLASLGLGLAVMSSMTTAAFGEEFGGEGSYVALNGTAGIDVGKSGDAADNSGGLGAVVGGFMTPHFSIEAQYDWLHDLAHLGTINVKAYALTGRIQPFGVLGMGFASIQSDELTGLWRGGAGVDFYVTDSWKIVTQATYADSFKTDGNMRHVVINLGVGYHFY